MADFIQDFTSPENLFNLARQPSMPRPMPSMPAPVSESAQSYQPNIGLEEYAPPALPSNVVRLPAQTKPSSNMAPTANNSFGKLAKTLTKIIKEKESTDNYQAINPKSSASGAYQYTDSTWNNYGGYPRAALAPPAIQDQRFAEDIAARLAKFDGDPYKAIAAHYLPALADDPDKWTQPFKVHGRTVKPVLSYIKYVVAGTPLEKGLNEYLAQQ